jgi:hypothetical protein
LAAALNGISADSGVFDPRGNAAEHLVANIIEGNAGLRKETDGQSLAFANQPEQQVFGIDVYRTELTGLVPGEEEDALRPFGKTLEHTELSGTVRRTLAPRALRLSGRGRLSGSKMQMSSGG